MAEKLSVAQLLERNKGAAAKYQLMPTFPEMAKLGIPPPNILIITCVDPRCTPEFFLNLQPGDGVIVMRNACGHVTPVLNDILAIDTLLNFTEVMIIHHIDCGTTYYKEAIVRDELRKRVPGNKSIDSMKFGDITNLEQSVKDDLEIFKSSPFVRKELVDKVYGFVFDIKTGELTPVKGNGHEA
ncbi:hypothetical protein MMC17_008783 [Xylographa soralifera]|nr:hypothetical protein [Xylographa soralifera]